MNNNFVCCPNCSSNNVNIQIVSENEQAGCLKIFLYVILALTCVGVPIMIIYLLLKGNKTVARKYYVCQNCGYSYYENNNNGIDSSLITPVIIAIVILIIIATITYPIVGNIINQSKESENKRKVEAYAKNIEYAIMEYEYDHNGDLPKSFDDIKTKLTNISDVRCYVGVNCDGKGNVVLRGCQVGNYYKTYYKYNSNKHNGAEVDEKRRSPSNGSVKGTCNY